MKKGYTVNKYRIILYNILKEGFDSANNIVIIAHNKLS